MILMIFGSLNKIAGTSKIYINPIARVSARNIMEGKTLGEKRVNVDFNVTNDELVHKIKVKSAELIDLCETMKIGNDGIAKSGEAYRAISLAQTHYEDAAMWAVKANFTK